MRDPGCAPVKMTLSSFHSCFSLLVFIVYGLVFQVHELHSAPLTVMGPPGPVTVAVGEDAVLPCRFSPAQSSQDMEVTWYREQLVPFVHRYKGGWDQNGNQMLEYVGRTELWKDGLAKGNVNLTIFDVQLSDRGNYTCFVDNGSDYDQAVVELQVTDPFFQNAHPWITALGIVSVAVVVLLIFAVYLFKIKGKREKQIAMRDAALRDRDAEIEKQAEELAWRRHAVPIEEVNVVLDSDTAHCCLVLSDDCKSVRREEKLQDIPDNPKRFDLWRCVLGSQGFASGRCYWEVEVDNTGGWAVGACRENVEKKGEIFFNPEKGFWAVGLWAGCFQALTFPENTFLSEIQAPKRIRVSLCYEERRVSFFGVDENIPIFTFQETQFEGKPVYPWFWLGSGTLLKMCP